MLCFYSMLAGHRVLRDADAVWKEKPGTNPLPVGKPGKIRLLSLARKKDANVGDMTPQGSYITPA